MTGLWKVQHVRRARLWKTYEGNDTLGSSQKRLKTLLLWATVSQVCCSMACCGPWSAKCRAALSLQSYKQPLSSHVSSHYLHPK